MVHISIKAFGINAMIDANMVPITAALIPFKNAFTHGTFFTFLR